MADDTGPRNLEKLRDMLPSMKMDRKRRKHRRPGARVIRYQKHPRQICGICQSLFDYAICAGNKVPDITLCEPCKVKLAEGYTALISVSGAYLFGKFKALKPELAGKVRIADDAMIEALATANKLHVQRSQSPPENPAGKA